MRKVLKDEDDDVRGFAAWAIWKVEEAASPDVIDALIEVLETRDHGWAASNRNARRHWPAGQGGFAGARKRPVRKGKTSIPLP